ncbi:MAG TPA: SUF system NifU family Fe-S cluster assembly protein [Candidatus Nanoarchaeia archaeon]|nr:SUF system NifU family Fe-S cluster assembly protein [Candidatus Nanoarchaeia archaeon]
MDNAIEQMYQENILEHFKHPRNFGTLKNASVEHHEKNPLCGDEIGMFLIIDKGKKVTDVKFNGHGCAISQASASMLTEKIKGMNLKDAEKLTKEDVLEMLGIELSAVRLKCALLSLDTLKNSIMIHEKYVVGK